MVYLFLSELIWILAILGFGTVLEVLVRLQGHKLELPAEGEIAVHGMFGLVVMSVIGTIANFFVPLNPIVSLMTLLTGLGLFVMGGRRLLFRVSTVDVTVLMTFLAYLCLTAFREIAPYDAGLYHIQAIKWTTQSAVPLGLANLHGKLGFNSSWFTIAALLELPFLSEKSPFIIYSLIIFFIGSTSYFSIKKPFSGRISLSGLFLTFMAFPLIFVGPIPSASPDLPVTLIVLFVAYLMMHSSESSLERRTYSLCAPLFAAFALTIKLSAAPLFLGSLLVRIWQHARWGEAKHPSKNSTANTPHFPLTILLACSLILIPWAVRGVLLSGCIAYPSRFGCVTSLQWTIPPVLAEGEAAWIRSSARRPYLPPEVVLSSWDWFRPWVGRVLSNTAFQLSIGLLIAGTGLLAASRLTRPGLRVGKDSFVPPFLVSLGGLTCWFLIAPAPRFGYGYLFSLALSVFCLGLMAVGISESTKEARVLMLGALLVPLLVKIGVVMIPLAGAVRLTEWPRIREVRVVQRETIEGVEIYTPAEGDQCWSAPLPCTPYFNRDLRVRRSANGLPKRFWLVK